MVNDLPVKNIKSVVPIMLMGVKVGQNSKQNIIISVF